MGQGLKYRDVVDFSRNPTKVQEDFFRRIAGSAKGVNPYRNHFYGGAIRGGKSFVSLAVLVYLAEKYPNSRWYIFRKDFPALAATTIPSMEKILQNHPDWKWNRDKSNYYAVHRNGSKIFFKGENIDRDPELTDLLGLEMNGACFEQLEELSKKLWDMVQSRLGSWYCDPVNDPDHLNDPKPITLATFNPSQTWIKEFIYEPFRSGTLPPQFFYQTALPTDNGYISKEQWENWERLPDRYKLQMIEGDWTDFSDKNNLWAFAFDRARHVSDAMPEIDPQHIVYLSFDFNRNPICCSVIQHIYGQIRVHETIKLGNSDIYELCAYITAHYGKYSFMITGDASGNNSSAMVKDSLNFYLIIKAQLNITQYEMKVPVSNPRLEDNQVLVNALLARYDVIIHSTKAAGLIYDLANVRMNSDGTILKKNRKDETQQADALDTFRYYCNIFHGDFIRWE